VITSASLDLFFAVDNTLGDPSAGVPNQGVYINGTAISGNSSGGSFTSQNEFNRTDIAPLLAFGSNTLFILANDEGRPRRTHLQRDDLDPDQS
jgi:hypothetical protein